MKKDFFNGKVREQYTGYMRTVLIFVACMFLCAAVLFLCMVLFYEKNGRGHAHNFICLCRRIICVNGGFPRGNRLLYMQLP